MRLFPLLFVVTALCTAQEAPPAAEPPGARKVQPASEEAEQAIRQFKVPEGFKVELFAAEPRVANISSFDVAPDGKLYVVEVFRRRGGGVLDMRNLPGWLEEDLALRTVEQRVEMVKRRVTPQELRTMRLESDRVRLVLDRDGDGRADHDAVFADGFNGLEDGTAAGVLALRDNVYFANIPHVWLLRDADRDGRADSRKALHSGYGVRYNISGHDLHGLRLGPDGRLYFSVGDRGLNVTAIDGRRVVNPDSGAVLRCELDGSNLELVHTGLRNPQDLAFDEFGNLFTGENNSDGGDASRWVHVVEGGDSGWRTGYQWHDTPVSRGPWNNERLWEANPKVPAAYLLPPLANPDIPGPAGLTYTPGTGMPPDWQNRFLLADFRGGPTNSVIWALQNKPKGAAFELVETKKLLQGALPTDVEFGYDGSVYFSDWVNGWVPVGVGRIYRIVHAEAAADPLVAETRRLMSEGMGKRTSEELARLLGHADVRVRVAAQLELTERKDVPALLKVANSRDDRLACLHAIWGMGHVGRREKTAVAPLVSLLSDDEDEVRAQAAKVLGESRYAAAEDRLIALLDDRSDRVRFFAAVALGRLGERRAVGPLLAMLQANDDRDPYLRHAGVMGLAGCGEVGALAATSKHPSRAARLGALLALRRQGRGEVAAFLADSDPLLVLEAARAINDVPVDAATPHLAKLLDRHDSFSDAKVRELVLLRALNAHFRIGTAESAAAVARFAADGRSPEVLRVEALRMLADWGKPATRDWVTGVYRPLPQRDGRVALDAVRPVLADILRTAPDRVRVAAASLVGAAGLTDPSVLVDLVRNRRFSGEARAAALGALVEQKPAQLISVVESALSDRDAVVRRAAIQAVSKLPDATVRLGTLLETATGRDQQSAFSALAAMQDAAADELLAHSVDKLMSNEVPPEARLDLLTAAESRQASSPAVAERLKRYQASLPKDDPLAPFAETLAGGDAARGRKIFTERADVQCLRCHAIKGEGGAAGPDLAGIGKRQSRQYLLESILLPAKHIAEGWETVTVRVKTGDTFAGVLKIEDANHVVLLDPEKGELKIEKAQVTGRRGGQTAMPHDIAQPLSKHDLRDLVEFLSGLK